MFIYSISYYVSFTRATFTAKVDAKFNIIWKSWKARQILRIWWTWLRKLSLPCQFEVFGRKSIFYAHGAFTFSKNWVSIEVDNWFVWISLIIFVQCEKNNFFPQNPVYIHQILLNIGWFLIANYLSKLWILNMHILLFPPILKNSALIVKKFN